MSGVRAFVMTVGRQLFGMTAEDAIRLGCCVRCRRDVNPRDLEVIDQAEWHLSGLCPTCYDALTEDECE